MTFSVVAYSPNEGKWGVGVSSRFLSVGSVVPWAIAGVGCIATQSYANYSYGPRGLDLLRTKSAEETLRILTSSDSDAERRQVAAVDSHGNAAAFTGSKCLEYAGHIVGNWYSVQGNILAGSEVLEAMAREMDSAGKLEDRIVRSLFAAQSEGGDRRGRQSAAILVVSSTESFEEGSDRYMDIRVEDARDPIKEINRISGIWKATFLDRNSEDIQDHRDEINKRLSELGFSRLEDWARDRNLDHSVNGGKIGSVALKILLGEENPEV